MKKLSIISMAILSVACMAGCSSGSSKAVETTVKIETSSESISVSGADNTSTEQMTLGRSQLPGLDDEKLEKIAELLNEKTFEKDEKISLEATGFKDCDDTTKDAFAMMLGRFADYNKDTNELVVKEKTELKFTFTSEKISYSYKAYK